MLNEEKSTFGGENQYPTEPNPTPTVPPPPKLLRDDLPKAFPTPRFLSKKLAAIILILIFSSFALSAGAYFLGRNSVLNELNPTQPVPPPPDEPIYEGSPTPDLYTEASRSATADWKTYESPVIDSLGYKLKYPNKWEIKTGVGGESNPQPRALSIDLKSPKCNSGSSDSLYIKHFLKTNPQQAYETVVKQSSDPGKNNIQYKTTYLDTANNNSIIKIESPLQKPVPVFHSYKTSSIGVYYIGGGGWCSSDFESIYDKIIKSLEFTQ